ncbi:SMI1/KNR4 family protein [Spirillospora sp. NPDC047279]|uniref:SMI1/KNR4 family protein n=1 Tax=Spirillospora sp. NPDC047279 TaxID=3155478 RepID=UPI0033C14413
MSSLDELRLILGRAEGSRPGPDWERVEREIGLRLPGDYKLIVTEYPGLTIDRFLTVHRPAGESFHDLRSFAESILEGARELRDEFDEIPYPLYPEEGGVYPWGSTANGDHVFWQVTGPPDSWPVVVAGRDYAEDDWWRFDGSASDFLAGVLTGRVSCPVLVEGFPRAEPTFSTHD